MVSDKKYYEPVDYAIYKRIYKRIIQHNNTKSKQMAFKKKVFRFVCRSRWIFDDIFMLILGGFLGLFFFLDIPGHGWGEYPVSLDDKVIVLCVVWIYFIAKMVFTIGSGTIL